jgi:hypothetical protein
MAGIAVEVGVEVEIDVGMQVGAGAGAGAGMTGEAGGGAMESEKRRSKLNAISRGSKSNVLTDLGRIKTRVCMDHSKNITIAGTLVLRGPSRGLGYQNQLRDLLPAHMINLFWQLV